MVSGIYPQTLEHATTEELKEILNSLYRCYFNVSEILVDESKWHISERKALDKILDELRKCDNDFGRVAIKVNERWV